MLVFPLANFANSALFLWRWWIRKKRLAEIRGAGSGLRTGISQSEFRRLIVTVLCVIFVYLPLALYGLALFIEVPKISFDIHRVHGPTWKFILFKPETKAPWNAWIGIALALTSFVLIGFTRDARKFYEHCIEWVYDHMPRSIQRRSTGMQKISQRCKERREATAVVKGTNMSMHDMYHSSKFSD